MNTELLESYKNYHCEWDVFHRILWHIENGLTFSSDTFLIYSKFLFHYIVIFSHVTTPWFVYNILQITSI